MVSSGDLFEQLISRGYSFFTAVPCSFLKPLINWSIHSDEVDYIASSGEGEAVANAAGAYLAGKKTVVMLQNSGLGNAVNPLTSLNYPFRIPTLIIVTLRGEPGTNDEPQHELTGQITGELLSAMRIPWEFFPVSANEIEPAIEKADKAMAESSLPFAFIMKKGSVENYPVTTDFLEYLPAKHQEIIGDFTLDRDKRMSRFEAVGIIRETLSNDDAIVATTGKVGRELFTLGDSPNQIYMVGSMGCASTIGFGIQRTMPRQRVVVLDGDGAVIMKMGSLSTIGYYKPGRFVHIILDNEAYESTGGQVATSITTDFASVAAACGYTKCWRADCPASLREAVHEAGKNVGPSLVHVKVAMTADPNLGRPTMKPVEVKARFMKYLSGELNA
jgi:phosphonopyruvate decarboxylase